MSRRRAVARGRAPAAGTLAETIPGSTAKRCKKCHVRVFIAFGAPVLNLRPDPTGEVAVTIASPRTGRFLARDEAPGRMEHSYSVHHCEAVADPGTEAP
jgi:hypothetical protein